MQSDLNIMLLLTVINEIIMNIRRIKNKTLAMNRASL